VAAALVKTDALLEQLFMRVNGVFEQRKRPGDVLYFLVSTDHGMDESTTGINLKRALNIPDAGGDVTIVTSGPVANVYVSRRLPEAGQATRVDGIVSMLATKPYASRLHVYRRNELPAEWGYNNPQRVGDIVVVCEAPATFESELSTEMAPLTDGPKGMHGYPVAWDGKMEGGLVIWRIDGDAAAGAGATGASGWGGRDLGVVRTEQLEATVAGWLGIRPARGAASGIGGL
jgi:hypothetical protein